MWEVDLPFILPAPPARIDGRQQDVSTKPCFVFVVTKQRALTSFRSLATTEPCLSLRQPHAYWRPAE
jgi:hypothetical protein